MKQDNKIFSKQNKANMTIDKKIIGGNLVIIAMLIIVMGVSLYSLNVIRDSYTEIVDVREQQLIKIDELRFNVRDEISNYYGYLLFHELQQEYLNLLRGNKEDFNEIMGTLQNNYISENELNILKEIEVLHNAQENALEKAIAFETSGNHNESLVVAIEEVRPLTDELIEKIDEFAETEMNLQSEQQTEVMATMDSLSSIMMMISIIAIISGLAFAFLITKSITNQLRESITLLSTSSAEILSTTTEISASSEETAVAANETTTTAEEVRQTAQLSSQKAKDISEIAQATANISQNGLMSVEKNVEVMNNIKEQMESIAETVMILSEQSQTIGGIIATVNDVAEQSNLLAVNASIEAAKAGEQGKGFGVVALEVRNLAKQSKEATTQVRIILNDIQKAINAAVMSTEQGAKSVEGGVKQAIQAGESIQQMVDSVDEFLQSAIQIAASSQQQLVGMDQITLAIENIKQATTQNVTGIKQAEEAAKALNDLANQLRSVIEKRK